MMRRVFDGVFCLGPSILPLPEGRKQLGYAV
jgi:hypothetical protein